MLCDRLDGPGLDVLDEPNPALSFTGCLAQISTLTHIAASGTSQATVATHSPVVARTPGARILDIGDDGLP